MHILSVGDQVVFVKSKQSTAPGPRAQQVNPSLKGDQYSYVVEKYWVVVAVHDDASVTLVTRRGKEHRVQLDNPLLRRANLWERFVYARRFPSP
ncbi:MAG: hypothetical protein ABI557_11140 [Aureliella sp.]